LPFPELLNSAQASLLFGTPDGFQFALSDHRSPAAPVHVDCPNAGTANPTANTALATESAIKNLEGLF